eukprot:2215192-Karenia_brevis.AAC.1
MQRTFGHQGHPGRFSPWAWDFQYDSFFWKSYGCDWTTLALDKNSWRQYRRAWLVSKIGTSPREACYGRL